jgi:type II restriction enzyme
LIHERSISLSCIVPRKLLSETARRFPWQGCNYRLAQIPNAVRINVVLNGHPIAKGEVMEKWEEVNSVFKGGLESRGWTADILKCVEKLYSTFTLENMYLYEGHLASRLSLSKR